MPEIRLNSLDFDRVFVDAYSLTGTRFKRWERVGMPRIPQNVMDGVVFLYESEADATAGTNPQGTGFIVWAPSQVNSSVQFGHFYVIANWHVAVSGGAPIVALKTHSGGIDPIPSDVDQWTFEPGGDDVAVLPIEVDLTKHKISYIHVGVFATPEWVSQNNVGFGDDVFMLGLFVDDLDLKIRLPKARFGNISAMPGPDTAIPQKTGSKRPSLVLDMHSRGGHSGSPVFAYRTLGSNLDNANSTNIGLTEGTIFKFIGVLWGQFPERLKLDSGEEVTGWSGMTCAIPSWRLDKILNHPDMQRHRMAKEEAQKTDPKVKLSVRAESAPKATDENPTHREDFMRLASAAARTQKQGE